MVSDSGEEVEEEGGIEATYQLTHTETQTYSDIR